MATAARAQRRRSVGALRPGPVAVALPGALGAETVASAVRRRSSLDLISEGVPLGDQPAPHRAVPRRRASLPVVRVATTHPDKWRRFSLDGWEAQYAPLPTGEPEVLTLSFEGHATKADLSKSHSLSRLSSDSDDSGNCSRIQRAGQEILEDIRLQLLSALVIIANALVIGFETDYPGWSGWDVVENAFLLFFTIELVLRVAVFGAKFFACSGNPDLVWNIFDLTIVSLGLLDLVVTIVAPCFGFIKFATVFRIIRLLRILRIFRIIRFLKQLYLLAYGFVEAAIAVFWVTFLMAFALYVCAIALTRMYGSLPHEDPDHDFFSAHYGSVLDAMWTLFELMSQPDLTEYHEVIRHHPSLLPFLVGFIIFGSFGMIALLTGVISESMFEKNQAKLEEERMERELKRLRFRQHCLNIFDAIDNDNDGTVTLEELNSAQEDITELLSSEDLYFTPEILHTLFDILDTDGSGTISAAEFENGVTQLCEGIRPMDIMEMQCQLRKCHARVEDCHQQLAGKLVQMDGRLDGLTETLGSVFSAVAGPRLSSTTGANADGHLPAAAEDHPIAQAAVAEPAVRAAGSLAPLAGGLADGEPPEAASGSSLHTRAPQAAPKAARGLAMAAPAASLAGGGGALHGVGAVVACPQTAASAPGRCEEPPAHGAGAGAGATSVAVPVIPVAAAAPGVAQAAELGPPYGSKGLTADEVVTAGTLAPAPGRPVAVSEEAGQRGTSAPVSGALAGPLTGTGGPVLDGRCSPAGEMPSPGFPDACHPVCHFASAVLEDFKIWLEELSKQLRADVLCAKAVGGRLGELLARQEEHVARLDGYSSKLDKVSALVMGFPASDGPVAEPLEAAVGSDFPLQEIRDRARGQRKKVKW